MHHLDVMLLSNRCVYCPSFSSVQLGWKTLVLYTAHLLLMERSLWNQTSFLNQYIIWKDSTFVYLVLYLVYCCWHMWSLDICIGLLGLATCPLAVWFGPFHEMLEGLLNNLNFLVWFSAFADFKKWVVSKHGLTYRKISGLSYRLKLMGIKQVYPGVQFLFSATIYIWVVSISVGEGDSMFHIWP